MAVAEKIESFMGKSSWIRKMFEEGARMKAKYGADKVFDLSLGNPNLPPPKEFQEALMVEAAVETEGIHGYMPNPGYPQVRAEIAKSASVDQEVSLTENEILMTCGAAGALNVTLKTILNPGEKVVVSKPYFVEYDFYLDNHGGELVTVPSTKSFGLDFNEIEKAIKKDTRALLINSPNNPSGVIYSKEELDKLGEILEAKSKEFGKVIYLISDEPYRRIAFDNIVVPGVLRAYKNSIVASSYSKELSLAGERIGYIAISPTADDKEKLFNGMALCNRILGFVNAPGLMQRVVAKIQGAKVDIEAYERKKQILCDGLREAGYDFVEPKGAFFLFPKSPIADDVEFVKILQEEKVLAVPGSGFGVPGHFRLSFCVSDSVIENSIKGFKAAIDKCKK
ncbi:MAG: pyridoxal phosphate-dependent aminotransferase [Desulforegulaceae bacterium]|nr:pyridoxal phosphate-dependent aminotransferase [Desulforegulaceae bacterium]